MILNEGDIERIALECFAKLGYTVLNGPEIAPGELFAEREKYEEVALGRRLRDALARLNPKIPAEALDEAFRKITISGSASLLQNNHAFHRMLVEGVDVEYQAEGRIVSDKARIVDYNELENNDWVAVNQFTVVEGQTNRRPDIVVFLNGMPVALIELKNPADENATIWAAFNQLQTYKNQIPSLFVFNELMIISDGLEARFGSLTANREWFLPWRTIDGDEIAPSSIPQLEVIIKGIFNKKRLLQLLLYFIAFEKEDKYLARKIIAGYHQFHAVNAAIESTIHACGAMSKAPEIKATKGDWGDLLAADPEEATRAGDRRAGVVWHTQGSGKSLTMAFYAGRIILHPALENPTIVVITDRNDLDDQLFGTFARCHELLRQSPVQAKDRADLRELLRVAAGGVIFTTIQKFLPEVKGDTFPRLSDRKNIIVIADEAHRSQYDFIDGFARHMRDALPNASFIGFTGTPIELTDKNTRAVFGDYISIYDIQQAVDDGATVPIYYESRLAKLELNESEKPNLDEEFEEITEGEEEEHKERLKTKWAALEAIVGARKRLHLIANDLALHFEERLTAMDGKAMVVCMSRRICVDLYNEIIKLRPEWHDAEDMKGTIKIVMTGSASDKLEWQQHIRNKLRREGLAKRFKDPKDSFRIVIVRDMWLTGFDVPCLHTMYVDKPMRGHGLMQAIARVNRVFHDKPGGLVVDYLGLADHLRRALANYTQSGGKGRTAIDQEEAVAVLLEKYEICCGLFHGFDWTIWKTGTPAQRLALLPAAQEHILKQNQGKERTLKAVTELSQAFALAVPHEQALAIRDDVSFFQAMRAALSKSSLLRIRPEDELDFAISQLVSKAVSSEQVIDIFAAAGLKKPDISILSDEFLAEVQNMPHKNLAVELLRKLLNDEIKTRARTNIVLARSFTEMLENAIRAYQNRAIETAQIIEELIVLAKEMRDAQRRGEKLGLNDDEIAFYDALETNDSAVQVLGDETLKTIARELVVTVRNNVSIDWTVKEGIRAKMRIMVKRILRKYGYPPDKQEKATRTVLEQAEVLCAE
ncbi:MAG: DEAD/DEAH box helicase [Candidatus Fischerbacteria bacterium RBG_13_37_8]|uniref:Type I restriction enzyme endonuclease subunit n=1 Tax=Candidatus Fischerbacteria bacterium RBG_13_37_8 TaxID=1817863 RepID=A0A1F5VWU7_9BACT|nr:MAG: DEAD/DEAH box helicase [Candidatus Fischerbacteria bacterium RBG_13_37_8]